MPICKTVLKAQKPSKKPYPDVLVTVGDHIKKKRTELGLLQKDVAKLLKVDECTITNWEKNHSQPKLHYLPQVIKFLGYVPYATSKVTFGDKIIAYRKEHGLSQRNLAKLLSVDQTTIRDWERNKHKPIKKSLEKIFNLLGIVLKN